MKCDTCTSKQHLLTADLYQCPSCDLISSDKRGEIQLYNHDYIKKYIAYSQTSLGKLLTDLRLEQILRHIPPGQTLLDYGCGSGHFISAAAAQFFTSGYDINPESIWNAPEVLLAEWDIVTFWDSLEHTNSPTTIIKNLNPRYICIAVPCTDDYPEKDLTGWKHYRPHEHIHHFSEKALRNLLISLNYEILEVNFKEAELRKGFNGKNIITIIGKRGLNGKN